MKIIGKSETFLIVSNAYGLFSTESMLNVIPAIGEIVTCFFQFLRVDDTISILVLNLFNYLVLGVLGFWGFGVLVFHDF